MAGRIILGVFNPALDANGVVDSGATLTFYQNGTTTPQAVYTDSTLATPLANPLSCIDASGRFVQIWAPDTSTYSVKVTLTSGTVVTYDKITPLSRPLSMTRQVLTSGTGATYTTPAGCNQIRVRMIGGGGGGGGATAGGGGSTGAVGGTTSFNSVTAVGGSGGNQIGGGSGGTAGTGGSSPNTLRFTGSGGGMGGEILATNPANPPGGMGGWGPFGGSHYSTTTGGAGADGAANSGAGGGGGVSGAGPTNFQSSGGGGAGEYVDMIINSPASSYTYTVGAGGAGGTGTTQAGGAGGSGTIIVEEFY